MPSPASERKASEIADEFMAAEFDEDAETKTWLVKKIAAALDEAKRVGYAKAMIKRL